MNAVTQTDFCPEAARHIIRNMREKDAAEVFCLQWTDDRDTYARVLDMLPTDLFSIFYSDGTPASLVGAYPIWPNVWSVFSFGTDKWDNCALALTKHVRRFIMPAAYNSGFHRAQAWSITTHTQAHAWMERSLGAKRECTVKGFGSGGEDFHLFVWDRPALEKTMGR